MGECRPENPIPGIDGRVLSPLRERPRLPLQFNSPNRRRESLLKGAATLSIRIKPSDMKAVPLRKLSRERHKGENGSSLGIVPPRRRREGFALEGTEVSPRHCLPAAKAVGEIIRSQIGKRHQSALVTNAPVLKERCETLLSPYRMKLMQSDHLSKVKRVGVLVSESSASIPSDEPPLLRIAKKLRGVLRCRHNDQNHPILEGAEEMTG